METTVTLQGVFEYSWWVALITGIIALVAAALIIYSVVVLVAANRKANKSLEKPKVRNLPPQFLYVVKGRYVNELQKLLTKYTNNKITKREAYQKLSVVIRKFVHEATGINVENYTAKEVKALGIRNLDQLMEEYYVPEFAEDVRAKEKDFISSCNTAAGVIKSWS